MKQIVKKVLKRVDKKFDLGFFSSPNEITLANLRRLSIESATYIEQNQIKPKLKVLWPTPFTIDKMWWAHDGILINALRVRGVEVIPTMCDKIQSSQCVFYSGKWQDYEEKQYGIKREDICRNCTQGDNLFWDVLGLNPIKLASFISTDERVQIRNEVSKLLRGDWKNYNLEGYSAGFEAWKAVVNNDLKADISEEWRQRGESLAGDHLFNILVLYRAYARLLKLYEPDRIFGNGGFYYFWGVLEHLAKEQNIPYFRYYPVGLHPLSWNYAKNSPKNVYLDEAWDSWIEQSWTEKQNQRVLNDLKERGFILDLPQNEIENIKKQICADYKVDPSKPLILLLTGVIWDANTNIPSPVFENMYDWLFKTIEWAKNHPELQFIIRVHPSENYLPVIASDTRTRFMDELRKKDLFVPPNVKIINFDEKVNTYHLMLASDLGITYSSTSGLEYACQGKPTILLGDCHYSHKGFTLHPEGEQNYFNLLSEFKRENSFAKSDQIMELARRYWYLYAFHASMVTGHMGAKLTNFAELKRGMDAVSAHLNPILLEEILPSGNEHIDFLCQSVIENLPILGPNRWPPDNMIGA